VGALVSVVIPTFNRSRTLERTLAALDRVQPPPEGGLEVVVVDDGSADEHARAVAGAVAARPYARLLAVPNRGPATARNAGVRATSGPLVAFLDDDCAPEADWLVRLTTPLLGGEPRLAGVGGRVLPAAPTNWVSAFCAATEYSSGVQPEFVNAATANACYRRTVLDEVGGFDEGFRHPGGDDPDLSARVRARGYRLEFVPAAIVYHEELESFRDFVGHMYRRGLGETRIAAKSGRAWWVVARAVLLPVFLLRTGLGCWRRTAGKGGMPSRVWWLGLELVGRTAFVIGSVRAFGRT
jgi:GT2 family glycosyltransferase